MQSIAEFFKEENDFLYRKGEVKGEVKGIEKGIEKGIVKGREEGREEERLKFVTNMVAQLGLHDEQIADIAGVPLSFIKNVRDGLTK